MKHYPALVDLGCFSRSDLVSLTGSREAANSMIYSYQKKNLIRHVRRDLFVTISLETKQPISNRFLIGSRIAPDACISHTSAFAYHGYANQVSYDVYVTTASRFREFTFDGYSYHPLPLKSYTGITTREDRVRVTEIERTVIDYIDDFETIGGLEELMSCLSLVPRLDSDKMLSYLHEKGSMFLWQKTGLILERMQNNLMLPKSFFTECQSRLPQSKRYLYRGLQGEENRINKPWRIYIPSNFELTLTQGVAFNARV
ncbi:MAG: transcriptional regulator [Symbiobacteriaceae bacterium]|nr:transcriptional regulator [Symbiobacteriaceae bacterium]